MPSFKKIFFFFKAYWKQATGNKEGEDQKLQHDHKQHRPRTPPVPSPAVLRAPLLLPVPGRTSRHALGDLPAAVHPGVQTSGSRRGRRWRSGQSQVYGFRVHWRAVHQPPEWRRSARPRQVVLRWAVGATELGGVGGGGGGGVWNKKN